MICPYPSAITTPKPDGLGVFRMHVGCGKCGACRHNKRTEWSFRINQEAKASKSCYFITLTYHDSVLPRSENYLPTLRKDHVQLFNKKLRKIQSERTDKKLRFFCVGEYGSKYFRPHYHIIYFNLLPELAEPENLIPIWEYGIPHRLHLDEGLMHYCTKYHVTANGKRGIVGDDDRVNEFTLASRGTVGLGGIGFQYIEKTKEWHLKSKTTIVSNNGFIQKMPSYYYREIFKDLSPEDKEIMRLDCERQFEEAQERELLKLMRGGFVNPEKELLRRQAYAASNVRVKADRKGIF